MEQLKTKLKTANFRMDVENCGLKCVQAAIDELIKEIDLVESSNLKQLQGASCTVSKLPKLDTRPRFFSWFKPVTPVTLSNFNKYGIEVQEVTKYTGTDNKSRIFATITYREESPLSIKVYHYILNTEIVISGAKKRIFRDDAYDPEDIVGGPWIVSVMP